MRDVLLTVGMLALFVGFVLTPLNFDVGTGLMWNGTFALVAGVPFWWREWSEEGGELED